MIQIKCPWAILLSACFLMCGCFEFDSLRIEETSPYISERNGVEPASHVTVVNLSENGGEVVSGFANMATITRIRFSITVWSWITAP